MKTNTIWAGSLIGLIAPFIAFICTNYTQWISIFQGKALAFYVLAAAINLFLIRYLYKNELDLSGRGVVLTTFLATLLLIITQKITI